MRLAATAAEYIDFTKATVCAACARTGLAFFSNRPKGDFSRHRRPR
jgi:hypothetical protein